jgi:hypothetical protein
LAVDEIHFVVEGFGDAVVASEAEHGDDFEVAIVRELIVACPASQNIVNSMQGTQPTLEASIGLRVSVP